MLASHRVLSWFSKNFVHSELKLGTKIRVHCFDITDHRNVIFINLSPNWRSSNTDTPHDITYISTCSFWSCARIFSDSRQSSVCRKERNVRVPYLQMFIAVVSNSPICGHFFFLSFIIHTYSLWLWYRANIQFLGRNLSFRLSFSKSILNYAPDTIASYSFIFIYRCCFNNCASWCAWFIFCFALTSLNFNLKNKTKLNISAQK